MTSSTLSITWCPTLSILLHCWLIMILKASFKWRQISVSFTEPDSFMWFFFALQHWLHFFVVDFFSIYLESMIEAISAAPPGVWTAAFVHLWNLRPSPPKKSEISISSTAYASLSIDVSFVGAGLTEHMDFHLKLTKIAASIFQTHKGG